MAGFAAKPPLGSEAHSDSTATRPPGNMGPREWPGDFDKPFSRLACMKLFMIVIVLT